VNEFRKQHEIAVSLLTELGLQYLRLERLPDGSFRYFGWTIPPVGGNGSPTEILPGNNFKTATTMNSSDIAVLPSAETATFEVVQGSEPLAFLEELLREAVQRHELLRREASGKILDTLENLVRCGWYADDLRHFLPPGEHYGQWVKARFEFSVQYMYQLRKLSRRFCRDAIDNDQRRRLGISIPGLTEIGEHLRRQIVATQASSASELFRYAGLLPAPGSSNGKTARSSDPAVDKILRSCNQLQTRLNRADPVRLAAEDRNRLRTALRAIAAYLTAL
jgi:hypothetical protein